MNADVFNAIRELEDALTFTHLKPATEAYIRRALDALYRALDTQMVEPL